MDWLTQFLQSIPGLGTNPANAMASGAPMTPGAGGEAAGIGLSDTSGADAQASAQPPVDRNNFLAGLRGVQAPKPPDVVKPSTPSVPVQRPIQGGDFLALLNSLSMPRTPLRPTTLGGSIGREGSPFGTGRTY